MTKDFLEGRWQFIKCDKSGSYLYKNIYNNNELKLSHKQVKDVLDGKTTLGKIMCRRMVYKITKKSIIERKFDNFVLGGMETGWCSPTAIRWQKLKGKYRKKLI